MRHWASHGYVCILPTHFYDPNALLQRSVRRLVEEMKRPIQIGATAWHARVQDITLVMDELPRLATLAPELEGKLDGSRIGVAGHSYGAFTAVLVAGAVLTDATTKARIDYGDPRPRAFILLSGQGRDPLGLTEDSWKSIARPMLVVGGSRDPSPYLNPGEWRMEPYQFAPPGDKYSLYLYGANHLSYIGPLFDRSMQDPAKRGPALKAMRGVARTMAQVNAGFDQTGIFEYTRIVTTAFWDAYLKDDPNAKGYLRSGALAAFSNNALEWKWK
jgi:predicted dienelactone hydrolase